VAGERGSVASLEVRVDASLGVNVNVDSSLECRHAPGAGEPAFREYVTARSASLLRMAYLLTHNRADAEDLVQAALAKTYQAWDRIEDRGAVDGYVRRAMVNTHISWWRRRRVEEYPTDELPEHGYDGESMSQVEMRVAVSRALMRLSARDREALSLRYYGSYTDTEIAERMGVSVGTVKSALWRALRKLRDDPALRPLAEYVSQNTEWLAEPCAAAA
jgi:RNA polymerase sigma-70 factor (sigma-E family)